MGLLRADLLKLARHPLTRWLVVGLLALAVLRGLVLPPSPDLPWVGLWSFQLVAVALIALTAILAGMEFSEDTFRSLVSRGVPRWGLLLSKAAALALTGGVLLLGTEGLATLLGVRSEWRWDDLARAWLSLWPYVSLTLLLTVLARNGGLALVVGVLWLPLEQFAGMVMAPMAEISSFSEGLRFLSPDGLLGSLYRWSLSYHGANLTYGGEGLRTPFPASLLILDAPSPVLTSALVLAGYVLLGLGLSLLVVHCRDVTEVIQDEKRFLGFLRPAGRRRVASSRRPLWTGSGPVLVRLAWANLYRLRRTALPKIGLLVCLLFPLALWGVARLLAAAHFEDLIFSPTPASSTPLAIGVSLLIVGPLATVLGILAVSNELSLGTRRVEWARGVTRLQTIAAQSLALMLAVGALFAFMMAVTLVIGASVSGAWPLGSAALAVGVAMLATGAYVGAAQVGGALTRSPLGAMGFGLVFLLVDWIAILLPTLMIDEPGQLLNLGRLGVFANTFGLASGGQIVGVGMDWQHLAAPAAVLVLVGYALVTHALAAAFAAWRDA